MSSLQHYGVKGMKWGVRRYQNKDGTLTSSGKARLHTKRTSKDVQEIIDSLSAKDRRLLGGEPGTEYLSSDEIDDVMKRFVTKIGGTPVAFLDIYKASNGAGTIALATKSGKDYRGKGYASDLVKKAQEWLATPEAKDSMKISTLNWFAKRENEPSLNLAKKYDFSEREDYKNDAEWWGGRYRRNGKTTNKKK